jgi:hypothetical protein
VASLLSLPVWAAKRGPRVILRQALGVVAAFSRASVGRLISRTHNTPALSL